MMTTKLSWISQNPGFLDAFDKPDDLRCLLFLTLLQQVPEAAEIRTVPQRQKARPSNCLSSYPFPPSFTRWCCQQHRLRKSLVFNGLMRLGIQGKWGSERCCSLGKLTKSSCQNVVPKFCLLMWCPSLLLWLYIQTCFFIFLVANRKWVRAFTVAKLTKPCHLQTEVVIRSWISSSQTVI